MQGRLARAIDTLRTDFAGRPDELRRYALELVADVTEASGGLWYELGMVKGEPYPARYLCRWPTPIVPLELPLRRQAEEEIPWPTGDPRLPPRQWNRSFVLLPSILRTSRAGEEFFSSRLYRRVWEPVGLVDQLRMQVYHRGEHVAWIGGLRCRGDRPFSRADVRRVAPIADALADALVAARDAERHGEAERGCDLLVTPRGVVVYASEAGERWLSRPHGRDTLRVWTRAIDRGERAPACIDGMRPRWTRMQGRGATRYLVHLEPVEPVRVHPGFVLSRTQREVARLAAAGATTSEIASMRGVSSETVRVHLKQIYELLGIGSRAELGRVFAEAGDDEMTVDALRRRVIAMKGSVTNGS